MSQRPPSGVGKTDSKGDKSERAGKGLGGSSGQPEASGQFGGYMMPGMPFPPPPPHGVPFHPAGAPLPFHHPYGYFPPPGANMWAHHQSPQMAPVALSARPRPPSVSVAATGATTKVSAAAAPWHTPKPSSSFITARPSYASQTASSAKVQVKVVAPAVGSEKKSGPIAVGTTGASVTEAAVAPPKEEWSASVRDYVERAFSTCKTPAQRDNMEEVLRVRIKNAIASGQMSKIFWEKEPLPELEPALKTATASAAVSVGSNKMSGLEKRTSLDARKMAHENALTSRRMPVSGKPTAVSERTAALDKRLPVPNKKSAAPTQNTAPVSEEERRRLERAKRFEADEREFRHQQQQNSLALQNVSIAENLADVIDWDEYTIVGTCQKLEKPYLRLTSAPDPATVRPLPVLKRALSMLKEKWRTAGDYNYVCDQFKSLRQDITVQRIKSDFTVQVYEIHARIAIERGDLGEYNQCQTQLKQLYAIGLSGSELEFMAYRLLYLIHVRNKQAISQFMAELSVDQRADPAVAHALQVRSALALGSYAQLFKLYRAAPNMSVYLMDLFVPRERLQAIATLLKAYRPSLRVSFLADVLAFPSEEECVTWLKELDVVVVDGLVDCKTALSAVLARQ